VQCNKDRGHASAGKSVWGSGFLPSLYQGVQLRSQGDPVLFLPDPPDHACDRRQRVMPDPEAGNLIARPRRR